MPKKKIIIFTSSGGAGHISATKAIQSYIDNEYETQPVFIFNEVFKNIDPTAVITFGKITGEDVYNYFLRKRWYKILNRLYNLGDWYFSLQTKAMKRMATAYLKDTNPDLVISVTPIINGILLDAAQTCNIPLLLIPTDLDVTTFIRGINNPSYKKFHLGLAFDDPLILKTVEPAHINPDYLSITGLPLRKDFFEPKDKTSIKKQYEIPENKPVIVLIMGGQGNSSLKAFAKEIAQLMMPAHIIICTGKDTSSHKALKAFIFNPAITTTIVGYTERISDFLAIADLLITKSGSVSFCEGIYMNVPMILDATATLLYWERLNHQMLIEHDWGISLKKISNLNSSIVSILANQKYHQEIKDSLKTFAKKRLDLEIKPLIEKLIK